MVQRRKWNACIEYNFISAGQGKTFIDQITKLEVNDIIALYITDVGYVGIALIEETAVPIGKFTHNGKELKNLPFISKHLFDNSKDPMLSEYAVKVRYIVTPKNRGNALRLKKTDCGFYAPRATVAKLDNAETITVLENFFNIKFLL